MGQVTINLPEEIAEYGPDLQYFVQTMVQKLHTNRHKGFCQDCPMEDIMDGLGDEVVEAHDALKSGDQFSFFTECADVANFAWLAGLNATRMTRREWDELPTRRKNVKTVTEA